MRQLSWLRVPLWLALVVLLASCSMLRGPSRSRTPQVPAVVPGLDALDPLPEYRLALVLDTAERRLRGREQVTFSNKSGAELNEIVFRLYPNLPQYSGRMNIGPAWVDGERTTSLLRAEQTSLVIPVARPLKPEARVVVSMTFEVEIPQRASGYVLFGYSQDIWSLPDAYPLLAVYDGTRWHEDIAPPHGDAVFADAAFYDVTLTLPPTLTLAATGSVVSDTMDIDGRKVYQIAGGPLREFACLASTQYAVAETTAQGAIVRSYYLPDDEPAGRAALNTAAAALRAYVDNFGTYPFPDMTVIEAPLEFYGMEYPGLNLIGVTLYRERRAQLEDRVVHEIAHQWWYAQVGNDQINTPWLDEGLAEYSMATYYRQVYGEARANTLINQRWLVPYQTAVENGFDAVVNQPSAAFGQEYEVIVYAKAALFFDALRQEVGDKVYQSVLRAYLDRYRWRIATPDDFLAVAESISDRDLDALYNHWILSKQ
jgi:Peptidase family M1 domain